LYRVIWQYATQTIGELSSETLRGTGELFARHANVFTDLPILGPPEPVFAGPPVTLRRNLLRLFARPADDEGLDLAGYHHAFVLERGDAERLRDRLAGSAEVIYAEIQPRPSCARWINKTDDGSPAPRMIAASLRDDATPDYSSAQGYLRAAPAGVDAHYAWSVAGGQGQGVRVIDVEWGWSFQHEDLRELQGGVVYGIKSSDDHGTAVLGIFSGDRNPLGVTGIASGAQAMGAAATYDNAVDPSTGAVLGKWNAAGAIQAATQKLQPGDVVILEMHGPGPNSREDPSTQQGFVPVEYWRAELAAIQHATQRGIHVVEAAGNGAENLDDSSYGGKFDRARRDSRAILVGGGRSALRPNPRSRLPWSNYGTRLDVHGWGEDIVTTGGRSDEYYCDLRNDEDPSRCYTKSFAGTSGASPIVAGAVACISGALRAAGRPQLSAIDMRRLLIDTGTPQGSGEPIGPLPNLRGALTALRLG
jgi:subtilisin family serine protease